MAGTLKGLWPWPWIGSYCIPSCIIHWSLLTCQISIKIKETFCGRTDVCTDRETKTFETGFIRPTLSKSQPKMETRHPIKGSFGSEFPAICNHCRVMAAWSSKMLKFWWTLWQNKGSRPSHVNTFAAVSLHKYRLKSCMGWVHRDLTGSQGGRYNAYNGPQCPGAKVTGKPWGWGQRQRNSNMIMSRILLYIYALA